LNECCYLPPFSPNSPTHSRRRPFSDPRGIRAAKQQGLRVTGTLGLLDLAAERGLVDFAGAIRKLEGTSFRRPEALLQALLNKHKRPDKP
jgi:predicted nucleic acid-binding protein